MVNSDGYLGSEVTRYFSDYDCKGTAKEKMVYNSAKNQLHILPNGVVRRVTPSTEKFLHKSSLYKAYRPDKALCGNNSSGPYIATVGNFENVGDVSSMGLKIPVQYPSEIRMEW